MNAKAYIHGDFLNIHGTPLHVLIFPGRDKNDPVSSELAYLHLMLGIVYLNHLKEAYSMYNTIDRKPVTETEDRIFRALCVREDLVLLTQFVLSVITCVLVSPMVVVCHSFSRSVPFLKAGTRKRRVIFPIAFVYKWSYALTWFIVCKSGFTKDPFVNLSSARANPQIYHIPIMRSVYLIWQFNPNLEGA